MLAEKLLEAAGNSTQPTYIEDVFSTWLYTGNGSTQSIVNGIDLAGKGGMVWIKKRGAGTGDHHLYDTVRGATYQLASDLSNATLTRATGLTAFNADGFSIGAYSEVNGSTDPHASWTFRKQPKFFDVVPFTANGSNPQTISHNLGSTPGCIIVKSTDNASSWLVYHRGLPDPNNQLLNLNGTGAIEANSGYWGSGPTSTTFQMNTAGISGWNFVAYVFAHNAGGFGLTGTDNVISCGSYTGNGSANGPVINLGYEPQWLMIKAASTTGNWWMMDTMRGMSQTDSLDLQANASTQELTDGQSYARPLATGFSPGINYAGVNGSGETYIYIAIRRGPMKVPTDATKVFAPVTDTGTASSKNIPAGFPIDMGIRSDRNKITWFPNTAYDRLQGASVYMNTNGTAANTDFTPFFTSFDQNGITITNSGFNGSGEPFINWFFRRAPSFFDEVCYPGDGTSNRQIKHNLTVAPELMILKSRSVGGANYQWWVYQKDIPTTPYPTNLTLNTNDAAYAWSSIINSPTSTTFGVNDSFGNPSGGTYVAYLFATCPGVSKVGSYTGNGSSQTINCGFSAGARFILIKRTDSTGDWYVWDTARGIVSGNDPHLSLNTTSAEVTTDDTIDPDSTGFVVNQLSATNVNVSSATYIYLAIA